MTEKTVRFMGYQATVQLGRYAKPANPRLQLWCADGPLCTASVNIDASLPEGMIAIKDYAENSGVLDALIDAGIVSEPLMAWGLGYVEAHICRLLI